jgi:ADP-ribose pyrophosphatase YjhB (NUDIX family)
MIKGLIYPIANRLLLQPLGRVTRGMTLGVRAVVRDDQGRFLVVRQSYTHGWIFPGGGVERGETPLQSLARELEEEAAVKLIGQPQMHGLFSNHANFPGDYVAVYCVSEYEDGSGSRPWKSPAVPFLRVKKSSRTAPMRCAGGWPNWLAKWSLRASGEGGTSVRALQSCLTAQAQP